LQVLLNDADKAFNDDCVAVVREAAAAAAVIRSRDASRLALRQLAGAASADRDVDVFLLANAGDGNCAFWSVAHALLHYCLTRPTDAAVAEVKRIVSDGYVDGAVKFAGYSAGARLFDASLVTKQMKGGARAVVEPAGDVLPRFVVWLRGLAAAVLRAHPTSLGTQALKEYRSYLEQRRGSQQPTAAYSVGKKSVNDFIAQVARDRTVWATPAMFTALGLAFGVGFVIAHVGASGSTVVRDLQPIAGFPHEDTPPARGVTFVVANSSNLHFECARILTGGGRFTAARFTLVAEHIRTATMSLAEAGREAAEAGRKVAAVVASMRGDQGSPVR